MIAKEDFPMEYQTYEVLDGLTCSEWRRLFAVSIPVAIVHKQLFLCKFKKRRHYSAIQCGSDDKSIENRLLKTKFNSESKSNTFAFSYTFRSISHI